MIRRLPLLVLLGGMVAIGVRVAGAPADPEVAREHPPVSPEAGEDSPTWYCAAGTVGGLADHTVVVTNPSDEKVQGSLTLFSGNGPDEPHRIAAPPRQEARLRLADLESAPPEAREEGTDETSLAVLVEIDEPHGTGVRVAHEVSGPQGTAVGPCATAGAPEWHFAWGATTKDARDVLVLFNPFPSDVVVDATFSTPDGLREPVRWQGLAVPGREVLAIDVGEDVTRRSHVAASVRARTGSLVVERLQAFDGSLDLEEGMRLALGEPVPVDMATFPGAGVDQTAGADDPGDRRDVGDGKELVVLYNPTDHTAKIEVIVRPEHPDEPEPLPFHLVVRPGQFETLDYAQEARVSRLGPHTTFVRSTNGVPFVPEQVLLG